MVGTLHQAFGSVVVKDVVAGMDAVSPSGRRIAVSVVEELLDIVLVVACASIKTGELEEVELASVDSVMGVPVEAPRSAVNVESDIVEEEALSDEVGLVRVVYGLKPVMG